MPLLPHEDTMGMTIYELGSGPSPDIEPHGPLIREFPDSRMTGMDLY